MGRNSLRFLMRRCFALALAGVIAVQPLQVIAVEYLAPASRIGSKGLSQDEADQHFQEKRRGAKDYWPEKMGLEGIVKILTSTAYKNPQAKPMRFVTQATATGIIPTDLPDKDFRVDGHSYRLRLPSQYGDRPVEIRFGYESSFGWLVNAFEYDIFHEQAAKDEHGNEKPAIGTWFFSPDRGIQRMDEEEDGAPAAIGTLIAMYHLDELYDLFRYAPIELEELLIHLFPGRFEPGSLAFFLQRQMISRRLSVPAADTVQDACSDFHLLQMPPLDPVARKILATRLERALLNALSFKQEGAFATDQAYEEELLRRLLLIEEKAKSIQNPQIRDILLTDVLKLFERAATYKPTWLKPGIHLKFFQKVAILHLSEEPELANAILADEPGFGKTLEAIGAIMEAQSKGDNRAIKSLIITKAITLHNWKDEILQMTNISEDEIAVIDADTAEKKIGQLEKATNNSKIRFLIISDSLIGRTVPKDQDLARSIVPDEIGEEEMLKEIQAYVPGSGLRFIVSQQQNVERWREAAVARGKLPSEALAVIDGESAEEIYQQIQEARANPQIRFVLLTKGAMAAHRQSLAADVQPEFHYLDKLKQWKPDFITVDEAHRMQAEDSLRSRAITSLGAARKLLLTATPVKGGRTTSLFPLLRWLHPEEFDAIVRTEKDIRKNPAKMNAFLRKRMLRRVKRELPREFTPLTHVEHPFDMDEEWAGYYKEILMHVMDLQSKGRISRLEFLNVLRLAAIHPGLVKEKYLPNPQWQYPPLEQAPKIRELLKLIREKRDRGEKVVVFSLSRPVIDALAMLLDAEKPGTDVIWLKEDDDAQDIRAKQSEFRHGKPGIFLSTYDKGSESLNLEAAATVIKLDLPWDPETNLQAENRVHRVTQTRPVEVISILARGTVDEILSRIVDRKMVTFAETVDAFLPIEEVGEDLVKEVIAWATAKDRREQFLLDYQEMRLLYARGDIAQAHALRERLTLELAYFYADLPESRAYHVMMLSVLKWIMEKNLFAPAKAGQNRPLLLGDFFCGIGQALRSLMQMDPNELQHALAGRFLKVIEIDPIEKMLQVSAQVNQVEGIARDSLQSDVHQAALGLPDKSLDILISSSLGLFPNAFPETGDLRHVTRRVWALAQMTRCLKDKGYLVLLTAQPMPAALQKALKEEFGITALTGQDQRLVDDKTIREMSGGNVQMQAQMKAILSRYYLFIGRKDKHYPADTERLEQISAQRRNDFKIAERPGGGDEGGERSPRDNGDAGGVMGRWPLSLDDVNGPDLKKKPREKAHNLMEILRWTEDEIAAKKRQIVELYDEQSKDQIPSPDDVAEQTGLTVSALGYLVLLINHPDKSPFDPRPKGLPDSYTPAPGPDAGGDKKPELPTAETKPLRIRFPTGSWNEALSMHAVLEAYEFYRIRYQCRPTITDLSRFFFGEDRASLANNLRRLLKIVRQINDETQFGIDIRTVAYRKVTTGRSGSTTAGGQKKPLPPSPPQSKGFYSQAISVPAPVSKALGKLKLKEPDWTQQEKDVLLAWSYFLDHQQRLPNLLELSADAGMSIQELLRTLSGINKKVDALPGIANLLHAETVLAKSGIWPAASFSVQFARCCIQVIGFARVKLATVEAGLFQDSMWIDLLQAPSPAENLQILSGLTGVSRDDLIKHLKTINYRLWLGGQNELAFADDGESMAIQTGATQRQTQELAGVVEALHALDQECKVNYADAVMDFLAEAIDPSQDGFSPQNAVQAARELLSVVEDLAQNPAYEILLDAFCEDIQGLSQNREIMDALRRYGSDAMLAALRLAHQILIEGNYDDLLSDVMRRDILILLYGNHVQAVEQLKRKFLQGEIRRVLTGKAPAPDDVARAFITSSLSADQLERLRDILAFFQEQSFPIDEIVAGQDGGVSFFQSDAGVRLLAMPLSQIREYLELLRQTDVRGDAMLEQRLVMFVIPFMPEMESENLHALNIFEAFCRARTADPSLLNDLLAMFRTYTRNNQVMKARELVDQTGKYLEGGLDTGLLKQLLADLSHGIGQPQDLVAMGEIMLLSQLFSMEETDYRKIIDDIRDSHVKPAKLAAMIKLAPDAMADERIVPIYKDDKGKRSMEGMIRGLTHWLREEHFSNDYKPESIDDDALRLSRYRQALESFIPRHWLEAVQNAGIRIRFAKFSNQTPVESLSQGLEILLRHAMLNHFLFAENLDEEEREQFLAFCKKAFRDVFSAQLSDLKMAFPELLADEGLARIYVESRLEIIRDALEGMNIRVLAEVAHRHGVDVPNFMLSFEDYSREFDGIAPDAAKRREMGKLLHDAQKLFPTLNSRHFPSMSFVSIALIQFAANIMARLPSERFAEQYARTARGFAKVSMTDTAHTMASEVAGTPSMIKLKEEMMAGVERGLLYAGLAASSLGSDLPRHCRDHAHLFDRQPAPLAFSATEKIHAGQIAMPIPVGETFVRVDMAQAFNGNPQNDAFITWILLFATAQMQSKKSLDQFDWVVQFMENLVARFANAHEALDAFDQLNFVREHRDHWQIKLMRALLNSYTSELGLREAYRNQKTRNDAMNLLAGCVLESVPILDFLVHYQPEIWRPLVSAHFFRPLLRAELQAAKTREQQGGLQAAGTKEKSILAAMLADPNFVFLPASSNILLDESLAVPVLADVLGHSLYINPKLLSGIQKGEDAEMARVAFSIFLAVSNPYQDITGTIIASLIAHPEWAPLMRKLPAWLAGRQIALRPEYQILVKNAEFMSQQVAQIKKSIAALGKGVSKRGGQTSADQQAVEKLSDAMTFRCYHSLQEDLLTHFRMTETDLLLQRPRLRLPGELGTEPEDSELIDSAA